MFALNMAKVISTRFKEKTKRRHFYCLIKLWRPSIIMTFFFGKGDGVYNNCKRITIKKNVNLHGCMAYFWTKYLYFCDFVV